MWHISGLKILIIHRWCCFIWPKRYGRVISCAGVSSQFKLFSKAKYSPNFRCYWLVLKRALYKTGYGNQFKCFVGSIFSLYCKLNSYLKTNQFDLSIWNYYHFICDDVVHRDWFLPVILRYFRFILQSVRFCREGTINPLELFQPTLTTS